MGEYSRENVWGMLGFCVGGIELMLVLVSAYPNPKNFILTEISSQSIMDTIQQLGNKIMKFY